MTYKPKTQPMAHQRINHERTAHALEWAAFWEQGTGKSKFLIDTAGYLWTEQQIQGMVVVAPGGVHLNWLTDELPTHLPDDIPLRALAYNASAAGTKWHQRALRELIEWDGFAVLLITYDAVITDRGKKALWDMLRTRRCLMACDESHRIKTPSARRTMTLINAGKYAPYKRILTGTPVANSPFDVYSQVRFLDPDYWKKTLGLSTFTEFKSYFGRFIRMTRGNGQQWDELIGYQNLDQLRDALSHISSRVTKEEAMDLPPKVYQPRYFELSPKQAEMYAMLKSQLLAWLDEPGPCSNCGGSGRLKYNDGSGEIDADCLTCEGTGAVRGGLVTAQLAIQRMLRLQQITCGYVTLDGETVPQVIPGPNPRLNLLLEVVEDTPGKIIIWCRFKRDVDLIIDALRRVGRKPVRYDGTLSDDELVESRRQFKEGDATDFVVTLDKGSEGLTLVEATTSVYYSNTFKLIQREQSEDRNHRKGQDQKVVYIDLVARGTIDEHIIKLLRAKKDVASQVTGDNIREWLK